MLAPSLPAQWVQSGALTTCTGTRSLVPQPGGHLNPSLSQGSLGKGLAGHGVPSGRREPHPFRVASVGHYLTLMGQLGRGPTDRAASRLPAPQPRPGRSAHSLHRSHRAWPGGAGRPSRTMVPTCLSPGGLSHPCRGGGGEWEWGTLAEPREICRKQMPQRKRLVGEWQAWPRGSVPPAPSGPPVHRVCPRAGGGGASRPEAFLPGSNELGLASSESSRCWGLRHSRANG